MSDPGAGDGLAVRGLAVRYGQHRAVKGVDIDVAPGEIVVILGANGAGKTSLLKAVAGTIAAEASSQVRLDGRTLSGLPPHQIVEAGLALVPEGRGIFGDLSVRENLLLGAFARRARAQQAENLQRVLNLFPRLAERGAQQARTMSGGEQQMVAIGRALMSAPRILMLDEPSLGLSPLLCGELFRTLKAVRATGVGILLVEQNARQSLAIADRACLLENGEVVGQGPADQLARDPAVQAAYLGGAAGHAAVPAAVPAPLPTPAPAARGGPPPAALAAQALASLTAATAVTARGVPAPAAAPAITTSADALLPTRIGDLVRIAARRQTEAVEAQRFGAGGPDGAALAARALDGLRASGTLDDALARIGAAARAAVGALPATAGAPGTPRPTATGGGAGPATAPGTSPPDGALPPIEVWRRPGVEVYRRRDDGRLHKED
jgi:branched-chain amino acid transport system ATP-binding protein